VGGVEARGAGDVHLVGGRGSKVDEGRERRGGEALGMSTWSAGHAVAYGPGEEDEEEVVVSATRGGVVQPTDRIGVSSCDRGGAGSARPC